DDFGVAAAGCSCGQQSVLVLFKHDLFRKNGSQFSGSCFRLRCQVAIPMGVMFEARFQSFDDRSACGESAPRLAALRAELKRRGLDGFVVPRADRYQNEYVPPCAERLAWLTGFTGSAGVAIVLADHAAIFVDGRYMVQVREEVDSAAFTV